MNSVKPKLIPSVLGTSIEALERDAAKVARLSDVVNYDVADGVFVPTKTPDPTEYPKLPSGTSVFWHLMVSDPLEYLEACLAHPTSMIAIHVESDNVGQVLTTLRSNDVFVGVTVNPGTRIAEIAHLLDVVQFVQVMTVDPGMQGRPFKPELLPKIDQIRSLSEELAVAVDGGANIATIQSITKYHPSYIAVGSALTQTDDPVDAWRTLNRLVDTVQ